jgi:hypothetical protein
VKVHHLNCGTMNMPTAPLVCHVLLIETDNGLVLVDSGFGSHDCLDKANRVGRRDMSSGRYSTTWRPPHTRSNASASAEKTSATS